MDATGIYKSLTWFVFDEFADFGKNSKLVQEMVRSKSDSNNIGLKKGQRSPISTFTTAQNKGKVSGMLEESDEVSAFTQGTYKSKKMVIETQIDRLKAKITRPIKNSEEQQQINIEKIQN